MFFQSHIKNKKICYRNSSQRCRKGSFSVKNGEIYGSAINGTTVETEKLSTKYTTNKTPIHKFGDSVVQRHQNQVNFWK